MKPSLLLILLGLWLYTIPCSSQNKGDIGIFGGTSFYLGDINPLIPFQQPSYTLGGIYRFNLNKRYALRFNLFYANLNGADTKNLYPQFNQGSFNTSLVDLGLQFEINYLEYLPTEKKHAYTPYLGFGIGNGTLLASSNGAAASFLTFPIATGLKLNINDRLSTGAELSFRKTFSDEIDGYSTLDNSQPASSIVNNDWYSFLGIFITYKFFKFAEKCPAYLNY